MDVVARFKRIALAIGAAIAICVVLGKVLPSVSPTNWSFDQYILFSQIKSAAIWFVALAAAAYVARTKITAVAVVLTVLIWCSSLYVLDQIAPPDQRDIMLLITQNFWGMVLVLFSAITGTKFGEWFYLRRVKHAESTT